MKVLGVVIAGGASSRMGKEKALVEIGGVTLIERVISRIRFQVGEVVINGNGDPQRFSKTGLDVIPDVLETGTPLAGLHAALKHGADLGFDAVLTVPSDTPFLPLDLVARLATAGQQCGAAVAISGGQKHYLTGLWSVAMAEKLAEVIVAQNLRRVMDVGNIFDVATASWDMEPHDPFLNINTPDDVVTAEAVLRG